MKTAEEILKEKILSFTPPEKALEQGYDLVDEKNYNLTKDLGLLKPIYDAMEEYAILKKIEALTPYLAWNDELADDVRETIEKLKTKLK